MIFELCFTFDIGQTMQTLFYLHRRVSTPEKKSCVQIMHNKADKVWIPSG